VPWRRRCPIAKSRPSHSSARWAADGKVSCHSSAGSALYNAAPAGHKPARGGCRIDTNLLKELRIAGNEREQEAARIPRWAWITAASVVVVAAIAGSAWWLVGTRPVPVQTADAIAPAGGANGGRAVLQATGYVTAHRQATVSAQITGTLTKVLIEEGAAVKQGQVIAQLEDSALRAALEVARANVKASQAQVVQARAQLAQAQADARRQDELVAQGMVTKQAAEQARTALAAAAAQLDARNREADAARAQESQAKVNFDYTVIRAPFSGVVTEKAAQVGEIVSPLSAGGGFTRTGIGTIVDMDSLEVDVDVNEAYIGQVSSNMAAQAVLDAYPDWRIPAHVIAVVPTADKGKATVKVRVALDVKDGRLVPNMAARVSFLQKPAPSPAESAAAQAPSGVLVPPQAIVQRDGRSVVFVVVDGRAVQRAVTPAPQDVGTMKLLPRDVAAGDKVIVSPPDALRDGAKVTTEATQR
jgi:RND family efflux transporter MFP subunit